jgi:hypothetical protein
MSYEQLIPHAMAIQRKAIEEYLKEKRLGPYDRTGNPRTPQEREDLLRSAQRKAEQALPDVSGLFQPFTEMPDPGSFDRLIAGADQAAATISTGLATPDPVSGRQYTKPLALDEVQDARTVTERWHGPAANEFRENFLTHFESRLHNQFLIALVIRGALAAEQNLWANARVDIDKVAHGTMDALDALEGCTKDEWTMNFTVGASVASVFAAVLGATTGGIALAVIGAASQVVAAAAPEDPPKTEYSAKTVQGVMDNMSEAIQCIYTLISAEEQKIAKALTAARQVMRESPALFIAPRPLLADSTAASVRADLGTAG